jgi:alpha-tubulin suppressor-like RCC1 family protein
MRTAWIVLTVPLLLVAGPTAAPARPASGWSNTALSWGLNWSGQLGDGTTTSRGTPGVIAGLGSNVTAVAGGQDGIVQIAAGDNFSLARDSQGHVWAWGANEWAQSATVGTR